MNESRRRPLLPMFSVGLAAVAIAWFTWAGVARLRADEAPAGQTGAPGARGETVDFARDIQPIFQSNCYKCHDAAKHKGGLRLDSKQTAFIGGDSGDPSLVAHDPEHSKIIQLVRGDDPNSVMPPKGERLKPEQIDLLVRWVKQGATWPDGIDKPAAALTHWSFNKPARPALPEVKNKAWVRNPIDAFVLAKLEAAGLTPRLEADRYTLGRRLYLDLIGIPPTPAELDAFVHDEAPDAVERLVDQLQANPHYGERWARMWLDAARYADSAGYGSDPLRKTCFRYRDWVIDAFNRNLPYDRFTVEQIAGDLLPNPTTEQLIATGFNRNTMTNTEGGTDAEEFRVAAVKDRVETTVQVWMGLTMGCAQCHTHKYDPITNREYYQIFAIFNQTEDANRQDEAPTIPTPTKEDESKVEQMKARIAAAEAKLKDRSKWTDAQAEWERSLASRQPKWAALDPIEMKSAGGATLTRLEDKSILASGALPATDVYTVTARLEQPGITAFRLEALPDKSLPHDGPGRANDGGFVLNDLKVSVAPAADAPPPAARFVRIELPGKMQMLSLAEVQAFAGDKNLALHAAARQSSTDFGGEAKFAVDGITDGIFGQHPTSHTAKSNDPWWEVDLGAAKPIDRVVIWNRTDSGLQSRLSHFRVSLLDADRKPVWETKVDPPPDPSLTLTLTGPRAIALVGATDSFHQTTNGEWPASKAIDTDAGAASGWAIAPEVGRAHVAVFRTASPVPDASGSTITFTLAHSAAGAPLGRFRLSATTANPPVNAVPEAVDAALAIAPEQRSAEQAAAAFDYFSATAPQVKSERDAIAKLQKELDAIKPATTAIMRELPAAKRRPSHVLVKGNFLNKGPVVQPAVLAAFNPLPKEAPADRLGLAQWIVDAENPLTARVAVNRFWGQLFGVGIVETQEDFGTQGQPPSNQALLDWLACEFQSSGWDMKRLVRTIVTSSTYRQSSRVTPDALEKDPKNRLFSRGPRHRLAAEAVRDQALAISGLLSTKMYGPSVFPPQPDGLWQAAFNGERTYPTSVGEDRYRRGIYVFWRRTVPYPSMSAFDAPSREICTLRRVPTSTPLQAFVTLNDPVYVECAQALAGRIMKGGGETAESRAAYALRLCLGRPPEAEQVARLLTLYESEAEHYRGDATAAKKLAGTGGGESSGDAAAWTVCANVLLNLDGVLTNH